MQFVNIREPEFDQKQVTQYMVCILHCPLVVAVDKLGRYFIRHSYGWEPRHGAPTPLPLDTLTVLCENCEDAEGLCERIRTRLRDEDKARKKAAAELRKEERIKRREAVTKRRSIQSKIGLSHAQAMAAFEASVSDLRKQIDAIAAELDSAVAQVAEAERVDDEAVLKSMGLEVGKIKVS